MTRARLFSRAEGNMRLHRTALTVCASLLGSLWAAQAVAQQPAPTNPLALDPPQGSAAAPAPGSPPAPPTAPSPAASPAPRAAAADVRDEPATEEPSDHDRFVHRFAIGYFGVSQVPYAGNLGTGTLATSYVQAPVIGVRYWMNRGVGLDLGVGLGASTFANSYSPAPSPAPQNPPSIFGFALHGGIPIAMAAAKHFTFEVVPEVSFGYATSTIEGATSSANISVNGIRFDLGGRVGGEIHFGFIGVPQLALQASVGLFMRYQTVNASQGATSASSAAFTLGTSVGNDPWAIFTDNVSALYYF
jgi:hypothetical protein